jgi:hypothetical protein
MSSAFEDLDGVDDTPAVQALFSSLGSALPELERLLDECSGEWAYEDPVYRVESRT